MRRPALRRIVTAQFLAETGDGIVTVALPLYVFARTDSPIATSLTFTAEMIAGAFLGIVGGVLADRFHRQRVLMLSFFARAVLLLAAAAAGPLWLTITLGIAARSLGQLDNPSFDALIPGLAVDDMQQVLAVRRFIQSVSIIVGPAIGAIAVWAFGPRETIALSALPFAIAIVLHLALGDIDKDRKRRIEHRSTASISELLAGMTIVVRTPVVRRLVCYWAIELSSVAITMASAIVWFDDDLGVGDYWYGLSVAAYGTGAALGLLLVGGRRFRMSMPKVLLLTGPVYAASCALCVIAEVPWLMGLGWLIWGIAMGPEMVTSEPEFVARIEPALRGRAFAGVGVANTLGAAVGFAVAGPLLARFGARTTTLATAVLILLTSLLWLGPTRRGLPPAPVFDQEADVESEAELGPHPLATLGERGEPFGL